MNAGGLRLRRDVLAVAYGDELTLRMADDLMILRDLGPDLVGTAHQAGLAILDRLPLPPRDRERLARVLDGLGWLATDDETELDGVFPPLAQAIRTHREHPDDLQATAVFTANEALVIPEDCGSREISVGLRFFLSRLDWFRLRTYACLYHLPPSEIAVIGDLPPRGSGILDPGPSGFIRSFGLRDGRWLATSTAKPGSVPGPRPQGRGTRVGDRLSVAEVPEGNLRRLARTNGRTLWIASGEHALPNLRFTTTPEILEGTPQWAIGVDWDPETAVTKSVAEAVERFVLGDARGDLLVREAAVDLCGDWLDPSSVASYTSQQRMRFGMADFDAKTPEWWVRGSRGRGEPIWLPAALVFCPFDGGEHWLAPGYSSSNGSAAHTCLEEAKRRAWLELVERDAFMRTYLSGRPPARLVHERLPAPAKEISDAISAISDRWSLLLLESTLGTPAIACCAWRDGRLCLGAAAAPAMFTAVEKAMTEALVQLRHPFSGGSLPHEQVRSPEHHGRYYSDPAIARRLSWLLDGTTVDLPPDWDAESLREEACYFVRETEPWYAVRCIDPRLIMLTFGWDNELLGHPAARAVLKPEWRSGEPIPPHPFA